MKNIIEESIDLNNSNQKYIIKNIISNILNKKNISTINYVIIIGIINKLLKNETKYNNMLFFIIDKICIRKLDKMRCELLNIIVTNKKNDDFTDYINVSKNGVDCNLIISKGM